MAWQSNKPLRLLAKQIHSFLKSEDCPLPIPDDSTDEVDLDLLRRELLDFVSQGTLEDDDQFAICCVFNYVGIGAEKDRLLELVNCDRQSLRSRTLAFEIMMQSGVTEAEEVLSLVDQDSLIEFHQIRMRILLRSMVERPELSTILSQLHEALEHDDLVISGFLSVDNLRREEKVSAAIAYRDIVLSAQHPVLRELSLDAIQEEGGIIGRSVMEALRSPAIIPEHRRQIQRCLANWSYPQRVVVDGKKLNAQLTWCDDLGEARLRFREDRTNGRFDILQFVFSPTTGLVSGTAKLDLLTEAEDDFLSSKGGSVDASIVEISPGHGAWLLFEARKNRLAQGLDNALHIEAILSRLENIVAPIVPVSLALAAPVDPAEIEELFSSPPYCHWIDPFEAKGGLCATLASTSFHVDLASTKWSASQSRNR